MSIEPRPWSVDLTLVDNHLAGFSFEHFYNHPTAISATVYFNHEVVGLTIILKLAELPATGK